MSTKEERMAQFEQWHENLLVKRNKVVKAQKAFIKGSSSVGQHAALNARLVTLHNLLMLSNQWEDLLTPAKREV